MIKMPTMKPVPQVISNSAEVQRYIEIGDELSRLHRSLRELLMNKKLDKRVPINELSDLIVGRICLMEGLLGDEKGGGEDA